MLQRIFMHSVLSAAFVVPLFNLTSAAASTIPMATVPVGNAGNAADTNTGGLYGAVGYNYNIGTYDVTLTQYTAFLGVAATDTYGLYNTSLATDGNVEAPRRRSGLSGSVQLRGDWRWPTSGDLRFLVRRRQVRELVGNREHRKRRVTTITGGGNNSGTVTVPTTAGTLPA